MFKRIISGVCIVLLILVLTEVVAVLRLKASINQYADYWQTRAQEPGQLTYVALGDSAAQGIGASRAQNGYVGLIADYLQQTTGKTVRVVNLSVSGAKISDVVTKQLPELANIKLHPDLVTIEIGANDVAGNFNAQTFTSSFNDLTAQLPAGTIVANMPYFGGRIRHNAQALIASSIIAQAAIQHNLRLANLQTSTREHNSVLNYASDYFHPTNRGYKNWAAAFKAQVPNNL